MQRRARSSTVRPVYATVPRLWTHPGATACVLGSGPSLTRADVRIALASVDGVIAVNDAYLYAPDALALYAADGQWWQWHSGAAVEHQQGRVTYPPFTGRFKYTLGRMTFPDVQVLKKGPETGLALDPSTVALGRNSAYQAINVAVHFGARRVLLLGVDMQGQPGAHFFGRHPNNSGPPVNICMQRFATMVEPLAALGVTVVNCSRSTALKVFPWMDLEQALGLTVRTA